MSGLQIVGIVLIALPLAAIVGVSAWVMSRQFGWRVAVGIWLGSCAFTGLVLLGSMLASGELG